METPMASEERLTQEQLDHFAKRLAARKQQLLDEIHEALRREGADERYDRIVGAAGDTADEALADLTRDLTNTRIDRATHELRDVEAAEQRMARGQYGYCIECGDFIGLQRLEAFPTAKRCLLHQQLYEKTHAAPRHRTGV